MDVQSSELRGGGEGREEWRHKLRGGGGEGRGGEGRKDGRQKKLRVGGAGAARS